MSSPTYPTPSAETPLIRLDSNSQEYVETCEDLVRATLVMFEGHPHIRVQAHHAPRSARLYLGPLIPLHQWFDFKESVDKLVGPYVRESRIPLGRKTLSRALEHGILAQIACLTERRRSHHMGEWFSLVRASVPDPFVHLDLEFAFRRLADRGILKLTKDGHRYSSESTDLRWFFGSGYVTAEITPQGWAYWESLTP